MTKEKSPDELIAYAESAERDDYPFEVTGADRALVLHALRVWKHSKHAHRWNVEPQEDGRLRVCRGEHEKTEDCRWEYFELVRASEPSGNWCQICMKHGLPPGHTHDIPSACCCNEGDLCPIHGIDRYGVNRGVPHE